MNAILTAGQLIPFASFTRTKCGSCRTTTADRSITIPTSVPSGYARQAAFEAGLRHGFRAYDAQNGA